MTLITSFLLTQALFSIAPEVVPSPNQGWLAFGDLRGHFEPCGCDPSSDFGGIARIGAVIANEVNLEPGSMVFNLGGLADPKKPRESEFIGRAVSLLPITATLYRPQDIGLNLQTLLSHPGGKGRLSELVYPEEKVAIFGFNGDVLPSGMKVEGLVKKWRKRTSDSKRLLLFHGSDSQLQTFVESRLFDEIISSSTLPLSAKAGAPEHRTMAAIVRKRAAGTTVLATPLGGVGILRGGFMQTKGSVALGAVFEQKADQLPVVEAKQVTWLGPETREESLLNPVIKEFRASAEQAFANLVKRRLPTLADSKFAGAEACKSCHLSEFEKWRETAHARAWQTLKDKNRHRDVYCIECHVVGFKDSGGFVSMKHSPKLADVQCETCHGPLKEHASNPTIKGQKATLDNCVSCHKPPHVFDFDRNVGWSEIAHGK